MAATKAGRKALEDILSTAVRPPKPKPQAPGVLRSTVTYYSRNNTQWWRVTIQRGPIVTKTRFSSQAEAETFVKANVKGRSKIVWITSPYDLDKY